MEKDKIDLVQEPSQSKIAERPAVTLTLEDLQRKVEALERAVQALAMGGVISVGPDGNLKVGYVPKFGMGRTLG